MACYSLASADMVDKKKKTLNLNPIDAMVIMKDTVVNKIQSLSKTIPNPFRATSPRR